ncbi:MAG: transcription antitermination factor NusB [Bdellovibrionales bacterium]|nr:transcription antitermination factor NusB [Bdellovibrionales bacterium]
MEQSLQQQKRKERIQILEALYQMEFQDKELKEQTNDVTNTVSEIIKHKEQIDQVLTEHSQNWKLSRMALLDLNILRLAVYEILFSSEKESPKIFINEAIEIAKIYGSSDSPRFINGILDSIALKERQE